MFAMLLALAPGADPTPQTFPLYPGKAPLAVGDSAADKPELTAYKPVKPNGTATGTANPSYTFDVLVTEWTPLDAQVGDLSTASVSWPVSGAITKATA